MIPHSFRLFGYAFSLMVVVAGAASSAALALGGSTAHGLLAWTLLALAVGVGMLRPSVGGRVHLAAAVCVGGGAFVLNNVPPWLGMVMLAGLVFPVAVLGRRFAWCWGRQVRGGWPLIFTATLCAALLCQIGTGPWLYLLMVLGVALPPMPRPPATSAQGNPADILAVTPVRRLSVLLGAAATSYAIFALLPFWLTFDSGSVVQDIRRLVTVSALLVLGWSTLGAGFGVGRNRPLYAALMCAVAAIGLVKAATTLDRLGEAEIFNSLMGWLPLLNILGEETRLSEIHWAWTPILTTVSAALPLIALGAVLRTTIGARESALPANQAISLMLCGASLAVLVFGLVAHPLLGGSRLAAAVCLLLATAVVAALEIRPRNLAATVAGLAVLVPLAWQGLPGTPQTGFPFFGYFDYHLVEDAGGRRAEVHALQSVERVFERNASEFLGRHLLADARNLVQVSPELEMDRRADALLPLLFVDQPKRALVAGTPHAGTLRALRQAGVRQVHWAVDPPELANLAWRFHPDWAGLALDGLSATVAEADDGFDYVLLREDAVWERRRSNFLPAQLRHAVQRLASGGVIAVALDPMRLVPGLIRPIADTLSAATGNPAKIMVMPHGLQAPTVLVLARKGLPLSPQAQPAAARIGVLAALNDTTHPIHPPTDLTLFEVVADRDRSDSFAMLLAGPLPHLSLALSSTPPFPTEELLPWRRAAGVLSGLDPATANSENQLGIAAILSDYMASQTWSLKDLQQIPLDRKVDVQHEILDELARLARANRSSDLLRRTCESFAWLLVQQREVEWNLQFLEVLVDECGWRSPQLLWAYGEVLNEMLEPEEAEKLAHEALDLQPGFELAEALIRKIHGEDDGLEDRHEHEGHLRH